MNLFDVAPIDELPITAAQWHRLTDRLAADEARALWRLFTYIAAHGMALPTDEQDRARIAGLGHRRFIVAAPLLVPFFDVEADGCWTKHNLVEWRQEKLDAKAKQRNDGRRGGLTKAENKRRAEEEQRQAERQARAEARARETGELPEGFAGTLGSGKAQASVDLVPPSQTLAGPYADPSCDPLGSGLAAGGLNDCSVGLSKKDRSPVIQSFETISGVEANTRDAGATDLGRVADADPTHEPAVIASVHARGTQPDPSRPLGESTAVPPISQAMPGDDELAQFINEAGGEGLATNWPKRRTLQDLRAACASGLDLRLDLLPEIKAFAEGALKGDKGKLMHPANKEIIAAARERRRRRLGKPARVVPLHPEVDVDDPRNRAAWRFYLKAKGKRSLPTEHRNGKQLAKVEPQLWADCQRRASDQGPRMSPREPARDGGRDRAHVAEGQPR